MKQADYLIKEEARYLCVAMGHENESLDEFVEAHKTCLSDLMYFPTRNAYGLSSVAGNHEKLAALQDEFEYVKKKMDDDTEKAVRLEKKVKVLTHGYEVYIIIGIITFMASNFIFFLFSLVYFTSLSCSLFIFNFFLAGKYFPFDNWQICLANISWPFVSFS